MCDRMSRFVWIACAVVACAGGCKSGENTSAKDEAAVREAFTAFQQALKAKDADKLWELLDSDSHSDAERAAKTVQDAYAKADAKTKAEQEKNFGLPGDELAKLTGKGYLKTNRFHGKYDEVPESKIDKITVEGDKGTVNYLEPDGDKEKCTLVRQEGNWKVSVPIPKAQ